MRPIAFPQFFILSKLSFQYPSSTARSTATRQRSPYSATLVPSSMHRQRSHSKASPKYSMSNLSGIMQVHCRACLCPANAEASPEYSFKIHIVNRNSSLRSNSLGLWNSTIKIIIIKQTKKRIHSNTVPCHENRYFRRSCCSWWLWNWFQKTWVVQEIKLRNSSHFRAVIVRFHAEAK